jgi:hypothetical protein
MKNIKARSLPNLKTFKRYVEAFAWFFGLLSIFNFFYITIISDGLMPIFPPAFLLAFPIIFVTVYYKNEARYRTVEKDDVGNIVMLIQLRRPQSLLEALELQPEVLKHKYKRKSLLQWAKFYNNYEAHTILTKQMTLYSSVD